MPKKKKEKEEDKREDDDQEYDKKMPKSHMKMSKRDHEDVMRGYRKHY